MGEQLSDQELQRILAILNTEFGYDEERHLFEYSPLDYSDLSAISYQRLLTLTDMMSKLLAAWKKRSRSDQQDNDSEDLNRYFDRNLYQMKQEDRVKLRSYSVLRVLEIFEGENKIKKIADKVNEAAIFLKKVLGFLLGRCLPMTLPFPVMSTILSHLIREEGLQQVGFVGEEEVKEVGWLYTHEFRTMVSMYDNIAFLYSLIRDIMFSYHRWFRSKRGGLYYYNTTTEVIRFHNFQNMRLRIEYLIRDVDIMKKAFGDKLDSDEPVE